VNDYTTETCIFQLEQLSIAVIDAVVRSDPAVVEQLVIEQCQWLKQLNPEHLGPEHRQRLIQVAKSVDAQQCLLGQALQVSEFFLLRLSETRKFNRIG